MPRKAKPKLSRADLAKIIDGKCADVERLKEWARGEEARRQAAGDGKRKSCDTQTVHDLNRG